MNVKTTKQEMLVNSTLSTWASMIWKALKVQDIDPEPIFIGAGISPQILDDPLQRIPVSLMSKLWPLAVAASNDSAFGIAVAKQVNPSTFHALGFSAMASKNSLEVLQRVIRYSKIITDGIDIKFQQQAGGVRLIVDSKPGYPQYVDASIEALMASPLHFSRIYIHWNPVPELVCFRHTCRTDIKIYEDFFGCKVLFEQPQNAVVFSDYQIMMKELVTANAALASANDDIAQSYLNSLSQNNTQQTLREYLAQEIETKVPSLKDTARALNMSERKLQQLLHSEGTQFKNILDEVKQTYATQWLNDGIKSVSQIAWALGFKEVSSFSRAFKRWTGQSPSAFVKGNKSHS